MPDPVRKPPVWLLVAAAATGPLALNIFVPSMPGLPQALATDPHRVQLALSLYLIGVAVGQLIYGPLSDRFGRRPILLAGFVLYTVASVACMLAPTIDLLIIGRVAQAFGGCAGMVLSRAIVRDAWGREEGTAVLALVIAGMAMAPTLGPAIGGFVDEHIGWRAVFALVVAFGGVVLLASGGLLPETNRTPTPLPGVAALWAAYRSLLARPAFLGPVLMVGCATSGFFAFLAGAPFLMVGVLNRPASEYGLFFIIISLGYVAANMVVARVVGRVGPRRLIAAGFGLSVLSPTIQFGFLAVDVFTPMVLFLPTVLLTFGNGLLMPPCMAAAVAADPRLAGTASGLTGFCQMGMGAIAMTAVSAIDHDDPVVMVGVVAVANLLGLAALWLALVRPSSSA